MATYGELGADSPQGPAQFLAALGTSFGDGFVAVGVWRGVCDDDRGV
jgi:hypothetical protein